MNKLRVFTYVALGFAIVGAGYYVYERNRINQLNKKVSSLEDALEQLKNAKQS